jgi:threonine/homoserine/homoserine lactone efflux protein
MKEPDGFSHECETSNPVLKVLNQNLVPSCVFFSLGLATTLLSPFAITFFSLLLSITLFFHDNYSSLFIAITLHPFLLFSLTWCLLFYFDEVNY